MNQNLAVSIEHIQFYDDVIASWEGPAQLPASVQPYASLKDLCAVFGLAYYQQRNRVMEDPVYKGHYHIHLSLNMMGKGANREVEDLGISLKRLPHWLAHLNANRINEAARPKVIRYQIECADVLYDYWMQKKRDERLIATHLLPSGFKRPWKAEYNDETYVKYICQLYGVEYVKRSDHLPPAVLATWISQVIRIDMPPCVKVEVRRRNQRNARGNRPYKDFQFFEDDYLTSVERERKKASFYYLQAALRAAQPKVRFFQLWADYLSSEKTVLQKSEDLGVVIPMKRFTLPLFAEFDQTGF